MHAIGCLPGTQRGRETAALGERALPPSVPHYFL